MSPAAGGQRSTRAAPSDMLSASTRTDENIHADRIQRRHSPGGDQGVRYVGTACVLFYTDCTVVSSASWLHWPCNCLQSSFQSCARDWVLTKNTPSVERRGPAGTAYTAGPALIFAWGMASSELANGHLNPFSLLPGCPCIFVAGCSSA